MSAVAHDEAQSLKDRIFTAAIAVFAEHGLAGARMEQIAGEAQTTKRMVVYYFKTRSSFIRPCCSTFMRVYAKRSSNWGSKMCRRSRRWCSW